MVGAPARLETANIFYDSDYAAGIARGRYRANTNCKLAKLVQRLARTENARRSFGGRRGIVWTHVKGHAGHPGNEWADILADVGRMQPFTSGSGDDREVYCKQFPYEQDEYEEGDTAQHFATATPMLERVLREGVLHFPAWKVPLSEHCVLH